MNNDGYAIIVENLVKRYGQVLAVDQVSFRVGKGEIFGFLGPNGAGKTTTVRILTGVIKAEEGSASILGFKSGSLSAKQISGVVPEMANALPFVMPGLLGMVLFFTSTAISPVVAPWETQARTLERLMSCPVTIPTIVLGDILASFVFGTLISLIAVIIGLALGMAISNLVILLLGIILSSFCFSSMGLIFSAAPSNTPSNIMMLSSLIKFPLIFIRGIFIPLNELPVWGRVISYISPLTYFTDIARHLIEKRGYLPISVDFLLLLALTVFFFTVAAGLHQKTMPKRI